MPPGFFPGRGSVRWWDWYTHEVVSAAAGETTSLSSPLGHINVHVRDGAILLLHAQPGYTTAETRAGPYALLITLPPSSGESAFGTAYIDDGVALPPCPNTTLDFRASAGRLTSEPVVGSPFNITSELTKVTILGLSDKPSNVMLQGTTLSSETWAFDHGRRELVVAGDGVHIDLNEDVTLEWN